jgi:diguanylate cyclase (GGDEF)-like protein
VICPGTSNAAVRGVAERLRAAVEAARIPTAKGEERVTVSVGGCVLASTPREATFEPLVMRADAALYDAKRSGRNCVVVAADL